MATVRRNNQINNRIAEGSTTTIDIPIGTGGF